MTINASLVVRRDDDLRVAQPRDPLPHGEAAVRLLDERGQVVHARPAQLLQDLDLVHDGGIHFIRSGQLGLLLKMDFLC